MFGAWADWLVARCERDLTSGFGETEKRIAGGPTTDKPVQEYCATPPFAPPPVTDQS